MKTAFASIVPVRNCEKVIIRCSGRWVSEDEVRGRFVRKGDVLGDMISCDIMLPYCTTRLYPAKPINVRDDDEFASLVW